MNFKKGLFGTHTQGFASVPWKTLEESFIIIFNPEYRAQESQLLGGGGNFARKDMRWREEGWVESGYSDLVTEDLVTEDLVFYKADTTEGI